MRKVVAAINMTLDGYCDHTSINPDEEIHQHYTDLLRQGEVILYGRITYDLMRYWQPMVKNPSGEKDMDDFADAIDKIHKIVFSNSLKPEDIGWESATLASRPLEEEVTELRSSGTGSDKNIYVGSRSLIIQLLKQDLIDEFQLCVHPVIAGGGLPLFENIQDKTILKLTKTKVFGSGAVIFYYEPAKS